MLTLAAVNVIVAGPKITRHHLDGICGGAASSDGGVVGPACGVATSTRRPSEKFPPKNDGAWDA